jgi:hypothetical protein
MNPDSYQLALLVVFIAVLLAVVVYCLKVSGHMVPWGDIPPGGGRWYFTICMFLGLACLLSYIAVAVAADGMPAWASLSILSASVIYLCMNVSYVYMLMLMHAGMAGPGGVRSTLAWGAGAAVALLVTALAIVGTTSVDSGYSVSLVGLALALVLHAVFNDAVGYAFTFHAPRRDAASPGIDHAALAHAELTTSRLS